MITPLLFIPSKKGRLGHQIPVLVKLSHISSSYAKIIIKQIFTHRSFPQVGQKQKTERKRKKERERKEERLNDGDNNDQATHGARKPPGPILQGLRVAQAAVTERRP